MKRLAGLLLLGLALPAQAADITVLTSAVTARPLAALADSWTRTSGSKVNFKVGSVGGTIANVGAAPADLVLLPPDSLTQVAARLKLGSTAPVANALFGLAARKGAPEPDISTVEKFAAVLKASTGIQFNDPAVGSASGAAVAEMLKRAEFAGVIARPMKELPGNAVSKGDADFAGGTLSEELPFDGAEVVGQFPASLNMHLDFAVAMLADAPAPDDAASFLAYIKSPAAKPVWQAAGFVVP